MTVSLSPTPAPEDYILLTLEHLLLVGRAAVLEIWSLPLQNHKSQTVRHLISDYYVGCHTASWGSYWRHLYSDSEAVVQCELFLTALNRNIITYLRVLLKEYNNCTARIYLLFFHQLHINRHNILQEICCSQYSLFSKHNTNHKQQKAPKMQFIHILYIVFYSRICYFLLFGKLGLHRLFLDY